MCFESHFIYHSIIEFWDKIIDLSFISIKADPFHFNAVTTEGLYWVNDYGVLGIAKVRIRVKIDMDQKLLNSW